MPVGNVLEALTARAGLNFVGGSKSYQTGSTTSVVATRSNWGSAPLDTAGHWTAETFALNRIKYGGWPVPFLYVNESPFSTPRALNALALWRQSLKLR